MSWEEMRTPVSVFGSLPGDSPLLVPVPTAPGYKQQRLHVLAADALATMSAFVRAALGYDLEIASGWRPHRWKSRQHYEETLVNKYGSVAKGRIYLAFDSPHETGLACDFGCGGLSPTSATIAWQKERPLHKWLVENAWKYGWTPYKAECWHYEHWVDLASYRAGRILPETSDDSGPLTTCADEQSVCEAPADWVHDKAGE